MIPDPLKLKPALFNLEPEAQNPQLITFSHR